MQNFNTKTIINCLNVVQIQNMHGCDTGISYGNPWGGKEKGREKRTTFSSLTQKSSIANRKKD